MKKTIFNIFNFLLAVLFLVSVLFATPSTSLSGVSKEKTPTDAESLQEFLTLDFPSLLDETNLLFLKESLNLNKKQMSTLAELKKDCGALIQISNESSRLINRASEQKAYEAKHGLIRERLTKKCVFSINQLKKMMNNKFYELTLWCAEQMHLDYLELRWVQTHSGQYPNFDKEVEKTEANKLVNQEYEKITETGEYKLFTAKRASDFKSSKEFDTYLKKHEKVFKSRAFQGRGESL